MHFPPQTLKPGYGPVAKHRDTESILEVKPSAWPNRDSNPMASVARSQSHCTTLPVKNKYSKSFHFFWSLEQLAYNTEPANLCLNVTPAISGVTDGGAGVRVVPPGKLNFKMGPPQRFHELQNTKVLLPFLETRWSWHFKYWNSAVLSKPTIIKWIVNSNCCSVAAWIVQHIVLNVHTVCDVIIARRCGTLPSFAALHFYLLWTVGWSCE